MVILQVIKINHWNNGTSQLLSNTKNIDVYVVHLAKLSHFELVTLKLNRITVCIGLCEVYESYDVRACVCMLEFVCVCQHTTHTL